jgi:Pyruvate/2-oxoacid:ferredoxin oxidoreductase gamma subunit
MDLCGTVMAAGGAWVYRATAFDRDLSDVMATAIKQPGFAMLDVWELCTAYYSPHNKLKKKDLFDLIDDHGFKRGLLADKPRPEYSTHYREVHGGEKKHLTAYPAIEKRFPNSVDKQTGIIIAGSAGQRIKSTSTLFAKAAMLSGLEATQKNDYPITVMTGHSISEIIISSARIDYTAIESPDYFIVMSEDGLRRARPRIEKLRESCTLFLEESLEVPDTAAHVMKLPLAETSKKANKLPVAIMALGAMLQASKLFPVEAFAFAVTNFQKMEFAESAVKALSTGVELIEKK